MSTLHHPNYLCNYLLHIQPGQPCPHSQRGSLHIPTLKTRPALQEIHTHRGWQGAIGNWCKIFVPLQIRLSSSIYYSMVNRRTLSRPTEPRKISRQTDIFEAHEADLRDVGVVLRKKFFAR